MQADNENTMKGGGKEPQSKRFRQGDLIMERYMILSELGQGGMGIVYKCFDEIAGIEVALKALSPELSHNTLEMEDIKDNFQLVSKLVHQNIAIYKNLEKDNSNGNYYLIMECVDGEDLRRWIRRKRKDGGIKYEDVQPIIKQVAEALDYAHEQKIIHRDIKPGNIMISANGKIKVLDFGLAAQIHTSMTRVSMAYHGTSGTGPYMAPEQWRGRAQGAAADQYALAVMTYEMLAGHLPFESTDAAVLREVVLNEIPEKIDGLSEIAWNVIARALAKDPKERFENCAAFVEALSDIEPAAAPQKEPEKNAEKSEPAVENVSDAFKRNVNGFWRKLFSGRVSRSEFWLFKLRWLLCAWLFVSVLSPVFYIDKILDIVNHFLVCAFLDFVLFVIITIPWTLGKAAHNTGHSGKKLFLLLLPVIGWIWLLILLRRKSQDGDNIYGEKTKLQLKKWNSPWVAGILILLIILLPASRFMAICFLANAGCMRTVKIPYGVTFIGDYAFHYCDNLRNVTIPDSVKTIGDYAFAGCDNLRNVTIPNSVETIGDSAFGSCKNLQSVTIPRHVKFVSNSFGSNTKVIKR